jgi:DNA-binding NarL/FixJ family response regulator
MNKPITIILADDHPVFRNGLIHVLTADPLLSVLGEASDGEAAFAQVEEHHPDVAILDISMPRMSGFQVAAAIQKRNLPTKVVILTMYRDELMFQKAMDFGVTGYILKENSVVETIACVKSVAAGQYYISPSSSGLLIEHTRRRHAAMSTIPGVSSLTPTEIRIYKLIAGSRTSKEIAEDLCVSYKTVENHRASITAKLNLHGTNALLRFALEHKDIL